MNINIQPAVNVAHLKTTQVCYCYYSHKQICNCVAVTFLHNGILYCKYTVNHKKRDILFLTITLANVDQFLYFLYHFNHEEILHATVAKFTTSP